MNAKRQPLDRTLTAAMQITLLLSAALLVLSPVLSAQTTENSSSTSSRHAASERTNAASKFPHGMKLILKDGSFQLVREYHVEGDRVRYYSLERSDWEVIPADLVDWKATKKVAEEDTQKDTALLSKAQRQDKERNPQTLDIDASLEVAPGIFLPPGDHLFVFDGKAVLPLPQVQTTSKISKIRVLERAMVPIVPNRHSISIPGAHAKLRIRSTQPEFYLRTDQAGVPDIELIRSKVYRRSRHVENIDESFGEQQAKGDILPLQRWTVAPGVYRFTLGQRLSPGEYVLAQMIPEQGIASYVWDFGVDARSARTTSKK